MLFLKNKKGNVTFAMLSSLVIALVTFVIALVVGFIIVSKGRDQIADSFGVGNLNETNCQTDGTLSAACNGTKTINDEMYNTTSWLGVIVIAVIGAAILGLVMLFRKR